MSAYWIAVEHRYVLSVWVWVWTNNLRRKFSINQGVTLMKSLFRIFIAIISGISTYFAFPIILVLIDRRVTNVFSLYPQGIILVWFPCVTFPFLIYYALKCRDAKKVQMSKNAQAIIIFSAGSLSLAPFIILGGISLNGVSLLLWRIALLLNLFFFSTIVLSSLYYLLRTALIVKGR